MCRFLRELFRLVHPCKKYQESLKSKLKPSRIAIYYLLMMLLCNLRAEMARQLADIQREMGELKLGKLTFPKVLEDAFWVGLEGEGLELSGLQADGA